MTKLITDPQLQSKLLALMEEGARLYRRGSGIETPPEHFLQNYCATKLMEIGFVVTVESNARAVCDWLNIPYDSNFFIDLMLWNPADDRGPRHSDVRAAVEIKIDPRDIASDVERTARLLTKTQFTNPQMFGYVIAGGRMFSNPEQPARGIEAAFPFAEGHGPISKRTFDETMPGEGQGHLFGAVIGIPIKPAAGAGSQ